MERFPSQRERPITGAPKAPDPHVRRECASLDLIKIESPTHALRRRPGPSERCGPSPCPYKPLGPTPVHAYTLLKILYSLKFFGLPCVIEEEPRFLTVLLVLKKSQL